MQQVFISTEPGLEAFTLRELYELGLIRSTSTADNHDVDRMKGGIEFAGDYNAVYQANLALRTASRVLIRMGSFHAAAFSELRKKAGRLPWERYLNPGQSVALKVTCHKSKLYHQNAVAERVIGAIGDRLNRQPQLKDVTENVKSEMPQLFIVRLVNNLCTVSADSSGELLHRRGYRLETAKAPLRETLAAGMIMASGWDMQSPLIDPFCGSGTIPIEAAMMANRIAPGGNRRFAFMDWPDFAPDIWQSVLEKSKPSASDSKAVILGSDRDAGAVQTAQANAERAGVAEWIDFFCRAVSAIEPTATGWIATNPPYGLRTGSGKDLRNLYAQFGNVLRARFRGWHIAILCSDRALLGNLGVELEITHSLSNGGIPVKLAVGVVEG